MMTTTVSTQGRVVIPAQVRKRLKMKKGTRIHVVEKDGAVVLTLMRSFDSPFGLSQDEPSTKNSPRAQYFERMAGFLETKGKLTKLLLAERRKEKKLEK